MVLHVVYAFSCWLASVSALALFMIAMNESSLHLPVCCLASFSSWFGRFPLSQHRYVNDDMSRRIVVRSNGFFIFGIMQPFWLPKCGLLVLRGINIKDVGVSTCRPYHVQALALPLSQDKQLQSAHAEVYYNVMGTNTTNADNKCWPQCCKIPMGYNTPTWTPRCRIFWESYKFARFVRRRNVRKRPLQNVLTLNHMAGVVGKDTS